MNEKTRHRFGVAIDFVAWCAAGPIGAALVYHEGAPIWFCASVVLVFFIVAVTVVLVPSFRRYMRQQSLFAYRFPEAELVGKYTLLEDEIETLRNKCFDEVLSIHPNIELRQWQERRWQAIRTDKVSAFALFPGMFSSSDWSERMAARHSLTEDFALECCVVAKWSDNSWHPTSISLIGNESEAATKLQQLL